MNAEVSTTSERAACPACSRPIPSGAPEGLCPACLLSPSIVSEPAHEPRELDVPTVAQLAPLFPAYELEAYVGRGGMGLVYRARERRLGRRVAIKVLPPELSRDPAFVERFEREARAQASLSAPFVVALHDFGEAGPYPYLVMDWVESGNLRQLPAQKDGGRIATLVARVCEGLEYAHAAGLVHRDVKPENILIDSRGSPRLADFGLAKLAAGTEPSLTGTHGVVGTLHYMAPEQQLSSLGPVDARADVFALGVVLYELLTGTLPLGRFPPPSEVGHDPRFDAIVDRCLQRDPASRYPDAASLRRDLEVLAGIAPLPSAAPPPSVHARLGGWVLVGQAVVALMVLLLASVGARVEAVLLGLTGLIVTALALAVTAVVGRSPRVAAPIALQPIHALVAALLLSSFHPYDPTPLVLASAIMASVSLLVGIWLLVGELGSRTVRALNALGRAVSSPRPSERPRAGG